MCGPTRIPGDDGAITTTEGNTSNPEGDVDEKTRSTGSVVVDVDPY